MTCIQISDYRTNADGTKAVRALLLADTLPQTLPTTGEGIPGMTADMTFLPASMIYTTDTNADKSVYIVNEAGQWVGVDGAISYSL